MPDQIDSVDKCASKHISIDAPIAFKRPVYLVKFVLNLNAMQDRFQMKAVRCFFQFVVRLIVPIQIANQRNTQDYDRRDQHTYVSTDRGQFVLVLLCSRIQDQFVSKLARTRVSTEKFLVDAG